MPVRPLDGEYLEKSTNLAGQLEEAFNNVGMSMMTPIELRNFNNKALRLTHGYSRSKDPVKKSLYGRWVAIKTRCNNSNTNCSKYYKENGITVCDSWNNSFENFMLWSLSNGYEIGLQIDRIDGTKGYSEDNCRWVSSITNNNNRKNNKIYSYKGYSGTLRQLSTLYNIPYQLLRSRIDDKWTIEKAIETPKLKNIKNA